MVPSAVVYSQIAKKIIQEQQTIIGPMAVEQAKKVIGVEISSSGDVSIIGDAKSVLGALVQQYENFFGQASIEVCKDALKSVNPPISSEELPDILK